MKCDHHCAECNAHEGGNWLSGEALTEKRLCFDCWFWMKHIERVNSPQSVRVNGNHFIIGEGTSGFRGHGGRTFTIQFNDGRLVVTSDLWSQGQIPMRLRARLPDNAVFLEGTP